MTATTLSHFPSSTTAVMTNKSFQIDFETWKPLSISDSFSKDLIRQFDLRQSLLNSNHNDNGYKEEEKEDEEEDGYQNDSDAIQQKDNTIIIGNNYKSDKNDNDSYNNANDHVSIDNNNLFLDNSSLTVTPTTTTRLPAVTPVGLRIDRSNKNDHNDMTFINSDDDNDSDNSTIKEKASNRNLLRKSSEYFRQRIKKIKMNNNKNMKEPPVVSTKKIDNSAVEVNNNTMILHYPPKPLQYSPEIHPAADNKAKKRQSLPFTFGSTTTNNNKYKCKQHVNHINISEQKKRNETNQPDKRKSFIIRSLLQR